MLRKFEHQTASSVKVYKNVYMIKAQCSTESIAQNNSSLCFSFLFIFLCVQKILQVCGFYEEQGKNI